MPALHGASKWCVHHFLDALIQVARVYNPSEEVKRWMFSDTNVDFRHFIYTLACLT